MALRITKVAELVEMEIVFSVRSGQNIAGEFVVALTNLEDAVPPGPRWTFSLAIGDGADKRDVEIELAGFLTPTQYEESKAEPLTVTPVLTIFRNRFFLSERICRTTAEREEVILRAKKLVFDEESEVTSLRSFVSNVEAAIEYQRSGPKRKPIPDDVKLLVWSCDGGACIRCGSQEKIHFDHILPVAKGGSNEPVNIQLLCQACNLKKSDKIAF